MGEVAPPQLKLPIGTIVRCAKDDHRWLFVGYRKTTVSTQLCFFDLSHKAWHDPSTYNVVNIATMEKKFPGITKIAETQPHVRKVLDLSTAHVDEKTAKLLTVTAQGQRSFPVICYEKGEYGFMIYISSDPAAAPHWPAVPEDLKALMLLAAKHECDWLMLDRDGVILSYLPTWEW